MNQIEQEKPKLVIIAGPTAAGKTDLSIKIAKQIGGEIISADSMQVYEYMDIGSAKITKEEMQGIPHYGIDILKPTDSFDVNQFQKHAKKALECIYQHGNIPILVGGTGFYIQALLYDIAFGKQKLEDGYRKELELISKEEGGVDRLYQMLEEVDPASLNKIHKNNVKRVIRALEYYHETGCPISKHNEEEASKPSPFDYLYFVINDERETLYKRIDNRVDRMISQGLVEEVKQLKEMGLDRSYVSMQGLGYKEILDYLDGVCSLEEAIEIIKRDTRHFAKRQIVWFKREPDVIWVNRNEHENENQMFSFVKNTICEKFQI